MTFSASFVTSAARAQSGSPHSNDTIENIETFFVPPRFLFVRVETSAYLTGWGEASLEGHAEAVDGAFAHICDRLIGSDPDRIEDAWQTLYCLGFYLGGPVLMSAISGVDQALWDIKGKRLGVPIWKMYASVAPRMQRQSAHNATAFARRLRFAAMQSLSVAITPRRPRSVRCVRKIFYA